MSTTISAPPNQAEPTQQATTITVPPNLAELTEQALNAVIQSSAMQNYQWEMTSGCQPSTLNAMYFCDSVSASGSYTLIPHVDSTGAHVDTNDHVDTNNHVDTPNHVDSKLAHDDAHWDVPGALGIPHTDSHTDSAPHDDTSAHDDTSTAHDDTSLPHDDTSAHYDTPAETTNYGATLTKLTGCGSMFFSDLQLPATIDIPTPVPATGYAIPFSSNIGFSSALTPYVAFYLAAFGLPVVNETDSVSVSDITGAGSGTLTLYCTGNTEGEAPGFYAQITSLSITLPSSVDSYQNWSGVVAGLIELGFETAWLTGLFDEMISELNSILNSVAIPAIEDELNSLLADICICSCSC
ncbi:MAG TPA: hypothetical protein VMF91_17840 [Bryobacteraceae bacterium]|nr:hypothetical protein [Bryobacteraceae bacterium]